MYSITEVFATLQGEGFHAGTPAVFVRFAACNLWSGHAPDRQRDAERHGALCPRFCDTDFLPRARLSAEALAERANQAAQAAGLTHVPLVVFTGGEPLLQLDGPLCAAVQAALTRPGHPPPRLAIETNGSVPLADDLRRRLWVCVSPKLPPARLALRGGDELKVVYPSYDPESYRQALGPFQHYFVSPEASAALAQIGSSRLSRDAMQAAAAYCLHHPAWRLSIQAHKVADIP